MADNQPQGLLKYDPQHRILICMQCCYAIQPTAISRHLKELHQIRRNERKELLESIRDVELADPADIQLPLADSLPVESLPVEDGVACNALGCGYLSVTTKRMKRHWTTEHGAVVADPANWRSVKLQTFFKGTQLRYFIVTPATTWTQSSSSYRADDDWLTSGPSNTEPYTNSATLPALDSEEPDRMLLDHYTAVTYKTLVQREEGPEFWRTNILQIARDHLFVMNGLLAISALHLAWLHPEHRSESKSFAYLHQQQGLVLYRSAMDHAGEKNCHALFAFSSILAVLEFAAPPSPDGLLFLMSQDDGELPAWLHLVRGGCALLFTIWHVILKGPMQQLIGSGQGPTDIANGPDDHHLTVLLPLFSQNSTVLAAGPAELEIYLESLNVLRWVFTLPYVNESSFTYRYVIQLWPAKVPQNFIVLLNERRPGALILLAFYCVLLERVQDCWYLEGRATQLLSHVRANLDPELLIWIQWPLQVLESHESTKEVS